MYDWALVMAQLAAIVRATLRSCMALEKIEVCRLVLKERNASIKKDIKPPDANDTELQTQMPPCNEIRSEVVEFQASRGMREDACTTLDCLSW